MAHRPITDIPPTAEQEEQICYWIKRGAIPDTAIARAGIPRTIFNRWLRAGAAGQEPFASFATRVEQALILFECTLIDFIAQNAEKNAATAQFLFNLRFGAKYKKIAEQEAGIEAAEALGLSNKVHHEATEEEIAAAEKRALEAAKRMEYVRPKALNFGLEEPTKPAKWREH